MSMTKSGVRLMVDHSVEERESADDWAENLTRKKQLLNICKHTFEGNAVFVPIKVTALASPRLLETMTEILSSSYGDVYLDRDIDIEQNLDKNDRKLLSNAMSNLLDLCEEAKRVGISIALDAEQSHRQPAIDYIANRLMHQCNVIGKKAPPVLYNTIQCYMIDSNRRLIRDIARAKENGYQYGVKLVRGAYLEGEKDRVPYPLHKSKLETDKSYDSAVELLMQNVASSSAGVLVATHNRLSVERAVDTMKRLGLPSNCSGVHFATIMGMCDHISLALGNSGYNALKLVLFGDFDDLFPWLLRRLDENQDIFGGAHDELQYLFGELRRRIIVG